jgi:hypothetical protein
VDSVIDRTATKRRAITRLIQLLTTGSVRCWGRNLSGETGYPGVGHVGDNELPHAAFDVGVK